MLFSLQVPSAYFMTDTFLMQNKLCNRKLLRELPENRFGTKVQQAAREGLKVKQCIGALRYLWRNSQVNAHHPAVASMKSELRESPQQAARRQHRHQPLADAAPEDAEPEPIAVAEDEAHDSGSEASGPGPDLEIASDLESGEGRMTMLKSEAILQLT